MRKLLIEGANSVRHNSAMSFFVKKFGMAFAASAFCFLALCEGLPWPVEAQVSGTEHLAETVPSQPVETAPMPWSPVEPNPADFDWIKLTTGEWLKGDILSLLDEVLEFDSEKLEEIAFDWEDVAELRSPRYNTIRLVDDTVLTGTLLLKGEDAVVGTFEGEKRFPRAELLTIIPGRPRERDYWSGAFTLGFTYDYGNTDQFKLTTKYRVRRQTAKSRLTIEGNGSFSVISDVQSENNQNATATYNVYLTQRFFVTPGTFNFFRDPFTNISYRLTPGAGLGYKLIDVKRYEWDVSTGLQYQYTRYTSVAEGEAPSLSTGAVYGLTTFEGELTDRIDLGYSYRIDTVIRDVANYTHNMQCSFSYEITDIFIFDITLYWDRVNQPAADEQGNVPVKDDFSIVFSTGVEF